MSVFNGYSDSTYYLTAKESPFTVGSSGSIVIGGTGGGAGINAFHANLANAVINNEGGITGGAGYRAGAGIYLQGGQITNSGGITGGIGDAAYNAGIFGYGEAGYGGAGVRAMDFIQLTN